MWGHCPMARRLTVIQSATTTRKALFKSCIIEFPPDESLPYGLREKN
jgi:hypothetical protein